MSIKSILVHLSDDENHEARLKTAILIAAQHGALVNALFIANPISMPGQITGRGASAAYLAAALETAKTTAESLAEEFKSACQKEGLDWNWIGEEGDHIALLERHSHAADLILVSRIEAEHLEDHFLLNMAEQLIMKAGIPVLLLPLDYKPAAPGKRILVAWKGTREAVRAVRNALPFLKSAEQVIVLTIGATAEDALSETEVVQYLARHGVTAEARNAEEGKEDVGEALLSYAAAHDCDMMVMGAYGHSRLREMLIGGVTRHVVGNTEIPVLMAH
ncbi:universal stress protein [Pelagibius sp.]|uniref:universal stress protein n=1 Tax=Pelagibius sp. TaxID=1931238 RepID=UPI00261E114C|nr:universal stress protein [Pelagibius sp.]